MLDIRAIGVSPSLIENNIVISGSPACTFSKTGSKSFGSLMAEVSMPYFSTRSLRMKIAGILPRSICVGTPYTNPSTLLPFNVSSPKISFRLVPYWSISPAISMICPECIYCTALVAFV